MGHPIPEQLGRMEKAAGRIARGWIPLDPGLVGVPQASLAQRERVEHVEVEAPMLEAYRTVWHRGVEIEAIRVAGLGQAQLIVARGPHPDSIRQLARPVAERKLELAQAPKFTAVESR